MSEEPSFLARWSRRKRGLEAEPPAALPAEATPALPAFDPASLPALDTLTAASDIAAFLRAEVPAALRNAALRRIWSLDPAIRDFTGPADYAWDYNAPDGVPGFSLDLIGEVKEMLAQAIGAAREAEPEAAPAEPPLLAEAAPAPLAPPTAAPEPPPHEAPPRRSHGGALPA